MLDAAFNLRLLEGFKNVHLLGSFKDRLNDRDNLRLRLDHFTAFKKRDCVSGKAMVTFFTKYLETAATRMAELDVEAALFKD